MGFKTGDRVKLNERVKKFKEDNPTNQDDFDRYNRHATVTNLMGDKMMIRYDGGSVDFEVAVADYQGTGEEPEDPKNLRFRPVQGH